MAFLIMTMMAALRALDRHRLRSTLAMLGIVIGVASLIVMMSIGEGTQAAVQNQLATFGRNMIMILRGAYTSSGVRSGHGGVVSLTIADIQVLEGLPEVSKVGWQKWGARQVVHEKHNWYTNITGVTPSYLAIRDWRISSGHGLNQADEDSMAKVVLLGRTVVEALFDEGDELVGATVRLSNMPFTVIGTLAPKGFDAYGADQDDIILMPFSTAERKVIGTQFIGSISIGYLSTASPDHVDRVATEAQRILRERHKLRPDQEDDFAVNNNREVAKIQLATSESMRHLLLAVTSISLLVGGIGIMNVLLVSVTQRTREIGIRMAVGAKRRHIRLQFLLEAIVLSGVGGLLGIAVGIGGASIASKIAHWPTIISLPSILLAFGFSSLVGLIFGLYPADFASRLHPVEALRGD